MFARDTYAAQPNLLLISTDIDDAIDVVKRNFSRNYCCASSPFFHILPWPMIMHEIIIFHVAARAYTTRRCIHGVRLCKHSRSQSIACECVKLITFFSAITSWIESGSNAKLITSKAISTFFNDGGFRPKIFFSSSDFRPTCVWLGGLAAAAFFLLLCVEECYTSFVRLWYFFFGGNKTATQTFHWFSHALD